MILPPPPGWAERVIATSPLFCTKCGERLDREERVAGFNLFDAAPVNWAWFWLNYRAYKRFVRRCVEKGYDPADIWYSRHTGFMCMPPFKEG